MPHFSYNFATFANQSGGRFCAITFLFLAVAGGRRGWVKAFENFFAGGRLDKEGYG